MALMCPLLWAHSSCHLENMIEHVLPSAHPSPQPNGKSISSAVCTVDGRKSLYFGMGDPFPQKFPLSWGIWTPSNLWFLGSVWAENPNSIMIGSAIFAQMTAECSYTLQWNAPFPPQNCPFPWGRGPHLIRFPGSTRVLNPRHPNQFSCFFAGLTSVTDWQIDRASRLVTTDHIYIRV